ncbi:MAG: histidinol-phosphate transaminase [Ignavibacteriales bacterium]|nr:MAG: histidinol-phosphate transaminase [Ignavibacteriales bacterium]
MVFVPEFIRNLSPYKAGKPIDELAREKGLTRIVKLASNENPLGPSPKALDAMKTVTGELHRYTDPSCYRLTHAVSAKYNQPADRVFAAAGSDAILQYIISTFSEPGDEVLTSEGTFIGWFVNVNKYDRKSVTVPQREYRYDLKTMADAITSQTKIIYLANPNNPTGTIFTKNEFEYFLAKVPDDILIIYDEAYTVYSEHNPEYPRGLDYKLNNLIVLRTFSKAYGLAGLRIGIAFGHPSVIRELYKVKLPFEPNLLAQEAAIASLGDDEFIQKTVELNRRSLRILEETADQLGINRTESAANFFMLLFDDTETAFEFHEECLASGLILRPLGSFGFPNAVRINSGTDEETAFAADVLKRVYKKVIADKISV